MGTDSTDVLMISEVYLPAFTRRGMLFLGIEDADQAFVNGTFRLRQPHT